MSALSTPVTPVTPLDIEAQLAQASESSPDAGQTHPQPTPSHALQIPKQIPARISRLRKSLRPRWHRNKIPKTKGTLLLTKNFLSLTHSGYYKAPKHGDASATYWKLYRSEAEINDKKFVDSLKGNTDSMVFLVRGDAHMICRSYYGLLRLPYRILCSLPSSHHLSSKYTRRSRPRVVPGITPFASISCCFSASS
jgi:hypothetical protein